VDQHGHGSRRHLDRFPAALDSCKPRLDERVADAKFVIRQRTHFYTLFVPSQRV
jgi:hypothetical protein